MGRSPVAGRSAPHLATGRSRFPQEGSIHCLRGYPKSRGEGQAALSSAAMFALGAALPLLAFMLCPLSWALPVVVATSLSSLALLGVVSARLGGARVWVAVMRVSFWGALAMGLTAGIGALFGTVV